jgi:hypothetical protein
MKERSFAEQIEVVTYLTDPKREREMGKPLLGMRLGT